MLVLVRRSAKEATRQMELRINCQLLLDICHQLHDRVVAYAIIPSLPM